MPLIRKDSATPALPAGASAAELSAASPDQRWAAVRELGGGPADVAALAQALLTETDARVREAIFTSLARSGSPKGLDAITPYLRSDDAQVRTGALDALRAVPQAVGPRLAALLADPDADVRLLACEIARGLPQPQATELLCALLDRETEVNVCASAIEVLAEVGGPDAEPALQRCAQRFGNEPFLAFSIQAAINRLGVQPPSHGR